MNALERSRARGAECERRRAGVRMSALDALRSALDGRGCKPHGDGESFKALCPCCQLDGQHHEPGLHAKRGAKRDLVLYCHGPGRCEYGAIMEAAGLPTPVRGGNADRPAIRPSAAPPRRDVAADVKRYADRLWKDPERLAFLRKQRGLSDVVILGAELGHDGARYVIPVLDADGRPLHLRRYLPAGEPKFTQPAGVQAQLYGVETLGNIGDGALVLVTEGELDALRCRTLGYNAVSGTGGAKCWHPEWTETLKRFELVVIGDHDPDGREMNRKATEALRKADATAAALDWPEGTAPKTDPTDYLRDHPAEDFNRLVEAARESQRLRTVDLGAAMTENAEPIPAILKGWIAAGDVVAFAGEPKTGKSWAAADLAFSLASGRPWLGAVPVIGGPYRVLYVDEEQNPRLVRHRARKLARGRGLDAAAVKALPIRYLAGNGLNLDAEAHLSRLWREVRSFKPDVVIFDSLVRFHRRNENDAAEMAAFAAAVFKPLVTHFGCTVVYLHHLAKPGMNRPAGDLVHRVRGSGDLVAGADGLFTLERNEDGSATLRQQPGRWEHTAEPLTVTLEDSDNGETVTLRAVEMVARAETVVLDALTDAATAGVRRKEVVTALENDGTKDADRTATRLLGRLHRTGRVRKDGNTHGVRYWLAAFAPPGAR
jgi:hypothetical protein